MVIVADCYVNLLFILVFMVPFLSNFIRRDLAIAYTQDLLLRKCPPKIACLLLLKIKKVARSSAFAFLKIKKVARSNCLRLLKN